MDGRLWDEYVSYVNTYYAVQEGVEELTQAGRLPSEGLRAFCEDANPFVWDTRTSAKHEVYENYLQAFRNHFASSKSTPADALEFCRSWLDGLQSAYPGGLLQVFDSVVDSLDTWTQAYEPISDQLDLRAKMNEWSPQESPTEELQDALGEEDNMARPIGNQPDRDPSLKLVIEGDDTDPDTSPVGPNDHVVRKATLSDTDALAALLAKNDPMLARSLDEYIMRGMQRGTVVELVMRHGDKVVACAGLTFADLMPTCQNPGGVYGVVSGVAALPGHEDDIPVLMRAIEQKAFRRGVGELTLLDTDDQSVQALKGCGFTHEGSRLLKRI